MRKFCIGIVMVLSSIVNAQDFVSLSATLVEEIRDNKDTDAIRMILKKASIEELSKELDTDRKRFTFWINVYNAFIQIILNENPDLYKDRTAFFEKPQIEIGGRKFSFKEIEHGILRRSQYEKFLGYLTNPFPPEFERKLRVEKRDWRIHFALNCGARSCPPIGIYYLKNIDKQLEYMATKYMKRTTTYSITNDKAEVIALFSWFRGDFGGPDGIRAILVDYGITPKRPKNVSSKHYNWSLYLRNYQDIPIE